MSEEQRIIVPVCGCGGSVEVDVEDGTFYVFGDTDRAKAVVWSEFDKIRNYPEIVAVLRKHGLTHEVDEMHARVDRMCRGDRGE